MVIDPTVVTVDGIKATNEFGHLVFSVPQKQHLSCSQWTQRSAKVIGVALPDLIFGHTFGRRSGSTSNCYKGGTHSVTTSGGGLLGKLGIVGSALFFLSFSYYRYGFGITNTVYACWCGYSKFSFVIVANSKCKPNKPV